MWQGDVPRWGICYPSSRVFLSNDKTFSWNENKKHDVWQLECMQKADTLATVHPLWPSETLAAIVLLWSCIKATSPTHLYAQRQFVTPSLVAEREKNNTQQLYTLVTVTEQLQAEWKNRRYASWLCTHLCVSFCTADVDQLPSRLYHPPGCPPRHCSNVWVTDPITIFIGLSLSRWEGTSLSPEQSGKLAIVLLVEKMIATIGAVNKWCAHTFESKQIHKDTQSCQLHPWGSDE